MKIKRVFLSTEDVKDKFPEQSPLTTTTAAANDNIQLEDEDEKMRNQNQLLKKMDIINELTIKNKSMKQELFASNELSKERRKLISIKEKEIKLLKENLKIKTEENQQKAEIIASDELSEKCRKLLLVKDEIIKLKSEENERLGISLSFKDEYIEKMGTELEELTEENKLLRQRFETKMEENQALENVLSNKIEEGKRKDDKIEDLEKQLSAEKKRKAPKRIVKRRILLPKENAACKNCQQSNVQQNDEEKKTQFVHKSIDSNVENAVSTPHSKPIPLPRSACIKLTSSPSQSILAEKDDDLAPLVQTSPENFVVSEKCEKQKKVENEEKETELNEKRGTEISNVTNNMSLPSQSILDEKDDDLSPLVQTSPENFVVSTELNQKSGTEISNVTNNLSSASQSVLTETVDELASLVQTSPENFVVSEKCQKQKKVENEEKETELNQKSGTEILNVTNNMSPPSQSILAERVGDLPSSSSKATSNLLDQTYSLSKFASSTPVLHKSPSVFKVPMKSDVTMPPRSPVFKSRAPTPESPLVRYNKNFSSSNPSPNVTPKRILPKIRPIFSPESQKKSMNFNTFKESNQARIHGTVSMHKIIDNLLFPGKMNDNNNDEKENVENSGD